MPNMEKVIADIEEQIAWIRDNDFHKFPGWGHAVLAMKDAIALLKEQNEGKYIPCKVKTETGKWDGEKCSVCGLTYLGSAPHKWRYCPDCGAKMEER